MMQYEPMTAEDKAIMKEFLQTPYYKVLKKACDTKLNDLMNELITLKKVENIDIINHLQSFIYDGLQLYDRPKPKKEHSDWSETT